MNGNHGIIAWNNRHTLERLVFLINSDSLSEIFSSLQSDLYTLALTTTQWAVLIFIFEGKKTLNLKFLYGFLNFERIFKFNNTNLFLGCLHWTDTHTTTWRRGLASFWWCWLQLIFWVCWVRDFFFSLLFLCSLYLSIFLKC